MFPSRSPARFRLLTVCFAVLLPALLAAPQRARAADPPTFRFCSIDIPFPPYARLDGTGYVQHLVVRAAHIAHIRFERHVAPRRRCFEELRNGLADGMIATYQNERMEAGAFPMTRSGEVDESKALGVVRFLVYRRTGTAVEWDGRRFSGVRDNRVGVESGFVAVVEKLRQLGMATDDGAKSLEQNLIKLDTGRVDAFVAMDLETSRLVAGRFAGRIEALEKPFDETVLYLMISKAFQARHPEVTDAYWQAIKVYRNSAEYRQYQQSNP
jgi:polar amino acid transport system substrate-binding protein